jgi:hypothetical protein
LEPQSVHCLLDNILLNLETSNVKYCIERNYDEYPSVIGGDVDLIVQNDDFSKTLVSIQNTATQLGWRTVMSHRNPQVVYICLSADRYPERFLLVIELFGGGIWKGLNFLTSKEILNSRRSYLNYWAPSGVHELLLTLTHHLLYNGKIFEKYRERICELFEENYNKFGEGLVDIFGKYVGNLIYVNISARNWKKIELNSNIIRFSFASRALLRSPFSNVANVCAIYFSNQKRPSGILIQMNDTTGDGFFIGSKLLDFAKKFHICIPPEKVLMNSKSCNLLKRKKVESIVNNGGLGIVYSNDILDFERHRFNVDNNSIFEIRLSREGVYFGNNVVKNKFICDLATVDAEVIWNIILNFKP